MTRVTIHWFESIRTLASIGFFALGLVGCTAVAVQAQSGTWANTGTLNTARSGHTATILPNGQVLVAGGEDANSSFLTSAELYNPATGKWTVTGSMATPRGNHSATLLPNGQVLVTGGMIGFGNNYPILTSSAELYDPSTGQWTTTGSMNTARYIHGQALLQNGQVLVAGGLDNFISQIASAELYDPATGRWTVTGSMIYPVASRATLLQNGQVLVAGGNGGTTAELYNSSVGQWTLTANMYYSEPSNDAVLLTNGDVLIYGAPNSPSYASEFYNPVTNVWARTSGQNYGNILGGPITLLANGKVLLAGGAGKYRSILWFAMLYDPSTNYWTLTGALNQSRRNHTLTRLSNGQALAVGGVSKNSNGHFIILASAELYTP